MTSPAKWRLCERREPASETTSSQASVASRSFSRTPRAIRSNYSSHLGNKRVAPAEREAGPHGGRTSYVAASVVAGGGGPGAPRAASRGARGRFPHARPPRL